MQLSGIETNSGIDTSDTTDGIDTTGGIGIPRARYRCWYRRNKRHKNRYRCRYQAGILPTSNTYTVHLCVGLVKCQVSRVRGALHKKARAGITQKRGSASVANQYLPIDSV